MKAYIFTDGASKGNPGPGGWGAVISAAGKISEVGGGEKETTNNRMELVAVIESLRNLYVLLGGKSEVVVFSDSAYVINGITKWIFGWEKNNWQNSKKEPVANADLWQGLKKETAGKNISWRQVPGHSDVAGNERANDIAEEFAFGRKPDLFEGQEKDYAISLLEGDQPLNRAGKVSDLKKLAKAKSSAKQKAYSYISLLDGRVEVHATWEECKARVDRKPALYKKALTPAEEAEIIADFKSR